MTAAQVNKSTTVWAEDVEVLKARVRELEGLLKFSELRYAKLDYKFRSLLERIYGAKTDALSPAQKLLFELLEQPVPPRSRSCGNRRCAVRSGRCRPDEKPQRQGASTQGSLPGESAREARGHRPA